MIIENKIFINVPCIGYKDFSLSEKGNKKRISMVTNGILV